MAIRQVVSARTCQHLCERVAGPRADRQLLRIKISIQLGCSHGRFDTICWNVDFGQPYDGIQDEFTKRRVAPIVVKVSAGKPKPTATVGPFHSPHHCFRTTFRRLYMGIRTFRINVRSISDGVAGRGDKDGCKTRSLQVSRCGCRPCRR